MTSFADRARGCIAFGAVGDALGAQVEFLQWPQIVRAFGPDGITEMPDQAWFTDDTQMTFFTVEGLIRSSVQRRATGRGDVVSVVLGSYWRWWWTQVGVSLGEAERPPNVVLDGWMAYEPRLNHAKAPGQSCLTALASRKHGTRADKVNDSKGCGAVMRAAPVGLAFWDLPAPELYQLSGDIGALTHGHPDGWGPAGALAVMVASLVRGRALADAVREATALTVGDTRRLLEKAAHLADNGALDHEVIERELGGGWVGEEALAIAVACALAWESEPERALRVSVNHSGDSDSTGAICGNLLGAAHGLGAVPARWLLAMQEFDLVKTVAEDFILELINPPVGDGQGGPHPGWAQRYPPS